MVRHEPDSLAAYPELLALAGKTPEQLLATLPARAAAPSEGAIFLADVLDNPEWFARQLEVPAEARQVERRVLASVIHQNLALDILGPLTTTLFLTGESDLPDPRELWFDPNQASGRWHRCGGGPKVSASTYIRQVTTLVNQWYPTFRTALGVSAGAYWSSSGLGLCAPYSALYDCAPPESLCDEASRWLSRFDCDARRFINWIPFNAGPTPCAIPQRRGCCQKYRLPDGGYCGTCGIYRKQRMASGATV
ncbi:(2Fe-2S)-binding protein [Marinobacter zhejiangensis]|uniref:FhuF 2Fe-2S C-terminal domain-containing protein n=1 Tax=Marinobacter zhejiangensis TaxID=488535 RepID=A0A1I4NE89_9GAMM|nr:(2Fe-2S)-binding protein [Marinobacter zhejiangensis]SFM13789.1 FhuF 2Fe-2S C-terminal domain-containing protein [Marinobacter zhejiangensis]